MKVCTFQVGDIVTIDTNAAKVEKLQKGHGEWVETMRNVNDEKNIFLFFFVNEKQRK